MMTDALSELKQAADYLWPSIFKEYKETNLMKTILDKDWDDNKKWKYVRELDAILAGRMRTSDSMSTWNLKAKEVGKTRLEYDFSTHTSDPDAKSRLFFPCFGESLIVVLHDALMQLTKQLLCPLRQAENGTEMTKKLTHNARHILNGFADVQSVSCDLSSFDSAINTKIKELGWMRAWQVIYYPCMKQMIFEMDYFAELTHERKATLLADINTHLTRGHVRLVAKMPGIGHEITDQYYTAD